MSYAIVYYAFVLYVMYSAPAPHKVMRASIQLSKVSWDEQNDISSVIYIHTLLHIHTCRLDIST